MRFYSLYRTLEADLCLVHIIADKANDAHHRHSTDPIVSLPLPCIDHLH